MKFFPVISVAATVVLANGLIVLAQTTDGMKEFVSDTEGYKVNYPAAWRRINTTQIGGAQLTLTPDGEKIETRFTIMFMPNQDGEKKPTSDEVDQMLLTMFKAAGGSDDRQSRGFKARSETCKESAGHS